MGASNVTAAFLAWPRLDPRQMRVLCYMAVVTRDVGTEDQSARLYFGGWEPLASQALGRRLPPEPSPEDDSDQAAAARKVRHAGRIAVTDAVAVLVRAGAITRVRAGGRGQRAEYRLNLDVFGRQGQGEPVAQGQGEPVAQGQGEPVAQGQGEPVAQGQGEPVAQGQGEPVSKEEQRRTEEYLPGGHHLGGKGYLADRPAAEELVPMSAAPRAALALLDRAMGRTPPERRPWCGSCHEPTRMVWSEPPDGGQCLGLCPTCNLPPGPP